MFRVREAEGNQALQGWRICHSQYVVNADVGPLECVDNLILESRPLLLCPSELTREGSQAHRLQSRVAGATCAICTGITDEACVIKFCEHTTAVRWRPAIVPIPIPWKLTPIESQ